MKRLRYLLEAALVALLFLLFRVIGLRASSWLGGAIARSIGPQLRVHKTAEENFAQALPEYNAQERARILRDMWDNLGRVAGEMPHIASLTGARFTQHVQVNGYDIIRHAAEHHKSYMLVSGHFGNWEVSLRSAAEYGHPLLAVYRHANNPYVDALIRYCRRNSHAGLVSKGRGAAKHIVKTIKEGGGIGLLADQKMNNGVAVELFGRDAMTAPEVAELALKYNIPLIPARVVRLRGTQFETRVYPPLDIAGKSPKEVLRMLHSLYESWIRETPAQWFWVHKRWPK